MDERDLEIVRLADARYRYEANRLEAARERFGLRPTAFYARVNRLIDDPDAAVAEPQVVSRLRRLRDSRSRAKRAS